eukprot:TRINITY_DN22702_c0_g1_i1.p1 TRINITY_DN22702_c0_g1~~TRINITY_DN22702_c0_g1_i1.p1  ORF type:complete len:734 (+),score=163.13 TRINITY_DN22702_c0_g1_i1:158-2359(+)
MPPPMLPEAAGSSLLKSPTAAEAHPTPRLLGLRPAFTSQASIASGLGERNSTFFNDLPSIEQFLFNSDEEAPSPGTPESLPPAAPPPGQRGWGLLRSAASQRNLVKRDLKKEVSGQGNRTNETDTLTWMLCAEKGKNERFQRREELLQQRARVVAEELLAQQTANEELRNQISSLNERLAEQDKLIARLQTELDSDTKQEEARKKVQEALSTLAKEKTRNVMLRTRLARLTRQLESAGEADAGDRPIEVDEAADPPPTQAAAEDARLQKARAEHAAAVGALEDKLERVQADADARLRAAEQRSAAMQRLLDEAKTTTLRLQRDLSHNRDECAALRVTLQKANNARDQAEQFLRSQRSAPGPAPLDAGAQPPPAPLPLPLPTPPTRAARAPPIVVREDTAVQTREVRCGVCGCKLGETAREPTAGDREREQHEAKVERLHDVLQSESLPVGQRMQLKAAAKRDSALATEEGALRQAMEALDFAMGCVSRVARDAPKASTTAGVVERMTALVNDARKRWESRRGEILEQRRALLEPLLYLQGGAAPKVCTVGGPLGEPGSCEVVHSPAAPRSARGHAAPRLQRPSVYRSPPEPSDSMQVVSSGPPAKQPGSADALSFAPAFSSRAIGSPLGPGTRPPSSPGVQPPSSFGGAHPQRAPREPHTAGRAQRRLSAGGAKPGPALRGHTFGNYLPSMPVASPRGSTPPAGRGRPAPEGGQLPPALGGTAPSRSQRPPLP